jgi:hypothetical protein
MPAEPNLAEQCVRQPDTGTPPTESGTATMRTQKIHRTLLMIMSKPRTASPLARPEKGRLCAHGEGQVEASG